MKIRDCFPGYLSSFFWKLGYICFNLTGALFYPWRHTQSAILCHVYVWMTATVPRQRVQRIRVKWWAPVPIVNIKMPRFFCKEVFDLPVLKTRGLSPTRTRTRSNIFKDHFDQTAPYCRNIAFNCYSQARSSVPPLPPPKIPLMNRLFENEPVSSWRNLYQIQICISTCVMSSECFKDNRSVFSQMDENALRTFTSNSRKLSW